MKYDDASWHYGGDFPSELPNEAGATHIGMFVAWAFLSGFANGLRMEEFPESLERLRRRDITPGAFFIATCDEKFTEEDLTEDGNAFAKAYFETDNGEYADDYERTVGGDLPSLYHVADSWETFDQLKPVIDDRLCQWRAKA